MAYDLVRYVRGQWGAGMRGQSSFVSENSLVAHLEVGIVLSGSRDNVEMRRTKSGGRFVFVVYPCFLTHATSLTRKP